MERAIVEIRRTAETFAKERNERLTSCHLVATLAHLPTPARDLLLDRRLTTEVLIKGSRVVSDEAADLAGKMLQVSRDAARNGGPEALYLLAAICQERTSAGYRLLQQCGTDITRLRSQALALASGVIPPRRHHAEEARTMAAENGARSESRLTQSPVTKPAHPTVPSRPQLPTGAQNPGSHSRIPHSSFANQPPTSVQPPPSRPAPPTDRDTNAGKHGGVHVKRDVKHTSSIVVSKKKELPRLERTPFDLEEKKFPHLLKHARNLSALAFQNVLDPTVARDETIELVLDIACRKEGKNPCLVGPSGIGKTALLRELARRLVKEATIKEPRTLLEIDPMSILAQRNKAGTDELAAVVEEVRKAGPRFILAIENFPSVLNMDGPDGLLQLRVAFARGELSIIGTSDVDDYRKVIESDPVYRRLMSAVEIEEPADEDAKKMVTAASLSFADHHSVTFEARAIEQAIDWAERYVGTPAMPQKALALLDLAGARAHRKGETTVDSSDVAAVVSEVTGVPESRLLETDGEKLLRLESLLEERVVGHKDALSRISSILRRSATRIRGKRPLGSFLLLGPTGVGKTEAAKAIAECMFGSEDAMTRLDLSEYAEAHSIARLIGAPPGYVGHEAGGYLTEAVKRRPYQVVLLDEIEKAHRDVLEAFLQVFDEGRLTDGRGRTVDFTNVVIVLTSNLGADRLPRSEQRGRIGFGSPMASFSAASADVKEILLQAARDALPPELYNRFDEVLAFGPLSRDEVREIARRMLRKLSIDLKDARGLELDMSEEAIDVLLDRGGYDLSLGARPMRRAIERLVEAPLADLLLRGAVVDGDLVLLGVEDGELVVDALKKSRRMAG